MPTSARFELLEVEKTTVDVPFVVVRFSVDDWRAELAYVVEVDVDLDDEWLARVEVLSARDTELRERPVAVRSPAARDVEAFVRGPLRGKVVDHALDYAAARFAELRA